jgi:hypothetical protein
MHSLGLKTDIIKDGLNTVSAAVLCDWAIRLGINKMSKGNQHGGYFLYVWNGKQISNENSEAIW